MYHFFFGSGFMVKFSKSISKQRTRSCRDLSIDMTVDRSIFGKPSSIYVLIPSRDKKLAFHFFF